MRVCAYIDGFNLYHVIANLGDPRLKWLNLYRLIELFTQRRVHQIEAVYYFSAFATHRGESSLHRHETYVEALKAVSVTPVMGKFKVKDRKCPLCRGSYKGHEEKFTDVNIALQMVDDAYQDKFDQAILVSQDSDLVPALEIVRRRFPDKDIKILTPHENHSREMLRLLDIKNFRFIRPKHLSLSRFPDQVLDAEGNLVADCPMEYR